MRAPGPIQPSLDGAAAALPVRRPARPPMPACGHSTGRGGGRPAGASGRSPKCGGGEAAGRNSPARRRVACGGARAVAARAAAALTPRRAPPVHSPPRPRAPPLHRPSAPRPAVPSYRPRVRMSSLLRPLSLPPQCPACAHAVQCAACRGRTCAVPRAPALRRAETSGRAAGDETDAPAALLPLRHNPPAGALRTRPDRRRRTLRRSPKRRRAAPRGLLPACVLHRRTALPPFALRPPHAHPACRLPCRGLACKRAARGRPIQLPCTAKNPAAIAPPMPGIWHCKPKQCKSLVKIAQIRPKFGMRYAQGRVRFYI